MILFYFFFLFGSFFFHVCKQKQKQTSKQTKNEPYSFCLPASCLSTIFHKHKIFRVDAACFYELANARSLVGGGRKCCSTHNISSLQDNKHPIHIVGAELFPRMDILSLSFGNGTCRNGIQGNVLWVNGPPPIQSFICIMVNIFNFAFYNFWLAKLYSNDLVVRIRCAKKLN